PKPVLVQEDIENVVSYLRGLEKQPMRSFRRVDRSPKMVAMGRRIFADNCARCHGTRGEGKHGTGEGAYAPSLNNPEFLKAADDSFLMATIALGRPGTPMPPFGLGFQGHRPFSADQIHAVIAFLRTWEKR
ncbi:MAG: c-type cytochrome, partial [Elusimicrobia bacterium]|nr:c-type cytochrome [Elusimicrobiota bacterium]